MFGAFLTRFKRGGRGVPAVSAPPARRASSFPYEGATVGRRLGTWSTTRDAVNSVWYQSADQLVSRSRDSARKDGWAAKAIDEWVCNAVGNGIKPQSLHSTPATKEKVQKLLVDIDDWLSANRPHWTEPGKLVGTGLTVFHYVQEPYDFTPLAEYQPPDAPALRFPAWREPALGGKSHNSAQ